MNEPRQAFAHWQTHDMSTSFKSFLKSGHAPTLVASFLYFAFSCGIWVLNGAMAPFISEAYRLSAAQMGLMLSVPIVAGALMRFPLGLLAQYIGRKSATLVEMGLIAVAMLFGLLYQGGSELSFARPEINRDMVVVIQGLVILFMGALEYAFRPWVAAVFFKAEGK
mgnify:CR=1 FL=1